MNTCRINLNFFVKDIPIVEFSHRSKETNVVVVKVILQYADMF